MRLSDEVSDSKQREAQVPTQDPATCMPALDNTEADHSESFNSKVLCKTGRGIAHAPL